jgi:hypothetical protein
VTLAVSVFGVPPTQALPVIRPSVPLAGTVEIVNVSSQDSGSLPLRLIVAGVSCAVVLLVAFAVGVVLGLTVRLTVA